jgi:hypothetical protein
MEMRETYIVARLGRPPSRRRCGVVGGEGSLDPREAQSRSARGHLIKNAQTAVLKASPRHDQRSLVGIHNSRVVHLRIKTDDRLEVLSTVLLGSAEVLGKLRLRLGQIGLLHPARLP